MNRVEKAEALFTSGCNCSQAVFTAFADEFGLDEELSKRLACALGGGSGRMRLPDDVDELGAFSEAFTQMVDTINDLVLEECEAEIQLQRARARQREMQLLYLRSQINPHFLYNTLGTIQMKAAMHDDDSVVDMIRQLILFFRNGLFGHREITWSAIGRRLSALAGHGSKSGEVKAHE